ncbi:MAG: phospholipase [Muribaculaceae bacterium]|nr:phospholipase [Muribaculaceae bacterium]
MTGALVILAAMVIIGILLYITDVTYFRHHHAAGSAETDNGSEASKTDEPQNNVSEEVCCGMHLICEKTSLAVVSDQVIYYDDEELDRFIGRDPQSYTYEETEEFRDVLLTLLPQDIAGWAKSITLRKIELPPEVKDELLLLVSELRSV